MIKTYGLSVSSLPNILGMPQSAMSFDFNFFHKFLHEALNMRIEKTVLLGFPYLIQAVKRIAVAIHNKAWISLGNTVINERSQSQKCIYFAILFI